MSEMVIPYEVRWAKAEEWAPAMKMIWKTFLKFEGEDYSPSAINRRCRPDLPVCTFLRGDYQMMVALDEERVIGAASVRNRNHLSLLFVDEEYHRRGVGRTLMKKMTEYLKTEAGERYMSLKASPYAVEFYRKLGFHAVTPEEEISGIRVTGMEKIL